jgi:hypothetical protein
VTPQLEGVTQIRDGSEHSSELQRLCLDEKKVVENYLTRRFIACTRIAFFALFRVDKYDAYLRWEKCETGRIVAKNRKELMRR